MGLMDTIKGWFSSAKETAGGVADKTGDVAGGAWDKTKDVAGDIKDKFDGDDAQEAVVDVEAAAEAVADEAPEPPAEG